MYFMVRVFSCVLRPQGQTLDEQTLAGFVVVQAPLRSRILYIGSEKTVHVLLSSGKHTAAVGVCGKMPLSFQSRLRSSVLDQNSAFWVQAEFKSSQGHGRKYTERQVRQNFECNT